MRTFLTLVFYLPAFLFAQSNSRNLDADQTYYLRTVDELALDPPYTAGAIYNSTIDLGITQDLNAVGIKNSWCIYASLSPTTTVGGTLQVSMGTYTPNTSVDLTRTQSTLTLTTTAQGFISGDGSMTSCILSYQIVGAFLPTDAIENFEVYYQIQNGSCPTP